MMKPEYAIVLAVALYVFLRWVLRPLTLRLPPSIDLLVDATSALLLTPEYACTRVLRKVIKRPMPLAFLYGEVVCGLAVVFHGLGLTLADGLDDASARIGHRQALIGGSVGALCLLLLS